MILTVHVPAVLLHLKLRPITTTLHLYVLSTTLSSNLSAIHLGVHYWGHTTTACCYSLPCAQFDQPVPCGSNNTSLSVFPGWVRFLGGREGGVGLLPGCYLPPAGALGQGVSSGSSLSLSLSPQVLRSSRAEGKGYLMGRNS